MLLVRHTATVEAEIHPRWIILLASDHNRPFYDEKVPIFVLDEIFFHLDICKFLTDEILESFVAGTYARYESDFAFMVFVIKQVKVVTRINTRRTQNAV